MNKLMNEENEKSQQNITSWKEKLKVRKLAFEEVAKKWHASSF